MSWHEAVKALRQFMQSVALTRYDHEAVLAACGRELSAVQLCLHKAQRWHGIPDEQWSLCRGHIE